MSKLRRKFITVLAVLFCALLCISAVLFIPNKSASAGTRASNSSAFREIDSGDLYTGNATQKSFNSTVLKKLYSALTGVDNATYKDVEDMVYPYGTNSNPTNITASKIYQNNGNKYVSVWFAGERWDATYMTTVRTDKASVDSSGNNIKGDIVLDLWLSSDRATDLASFADRTTLSSSGNVNQPDGMYGNSKIRVETLNAGGYYSTDRDSGGVNVSQNAGNRWARFTMSQADLNNGKISVKEFLVQPQYIEYQEKEQTPSYSLATYQCPNDAYDNTVSNYSWETGHYMSLFCDKTGYTAWKEDYVWLPSYAETGNAGHATTSTFVNTAGIWQTTGILRAADDGGTWVRSCWCGLASQPCFMVADINSSDTANYYANSQLSVRPAIHLNLTKAEKARGIDFGTDDTDSGTDNGVKFEELTKTYTGEEFTLDIPDYDKLDFNVVTNGNVTSSEVNNIKGNGKFKAKEPKTNEDKSYAITVTPKSGQYWDDTSNATERTATRQYRIKIEPAEMSVGWGTLNVAYGASLLGQSASNITSPDLDPAVTFTTSSIEYIIVKPNDTFDPDSPPSKEDGNWSAAPTNSTATEMGTYHVWYKITANFHKVEIFYYDVNIAQDTLTVTVTDESAISGDYAQYDGTFNPNDAGWLKGKFADKVKIETGSNTYNTPSAVLNFLTAQSLEVVFLKEDGSEPTLNGYNRHDAGTYILGLKDSSGSYGINWTDNKHPEVEIEKLSVRVKLIAKNGGDLKSTYGDNPVDLEYSIINGLLSDEKLADIKPRYDSFKIEDETALTKSTPAGTHQVKGATWDSNYDVTFDTTNYVVDPRPITLKIDDKEVEYGTDLTDYKFPMTKTSGDLVGSDDLDVLTADAVFKVTYNGTDASVSNLFIGEYDVSGTVPKGNYIFTVEGGKLTVTKANFDMEGVKLENTNKLYDGTPKPLVISGPLPSDEITVSYRYVNTADGSESTDPPVEVGLYLVYASFNHSNSNYNAIDDKVAYLRIVSSADELNQGFPQLPSDEDIAAAKDLAEKKAEAKKKLDEEAKAKKDAIDSNADMTAEDKKAAKEEIEKELAEGNAAIDKATNASDVNKAYDDGKKEMEDTLELAETKTDAKKELGEEAKAKKDAIDADKNLTSEEKAAAKEEIDKQLEEGKKEIDKSTNVKDVEAAESASEKNIEDYTEVVQKKGSAKSDLDKVAQDKKDAIDADSNLTAEEKTAAKAEVDKELAEGKKEIDKSTDKDGIESAESTAEKKIEDLTAMAQKKGAAKSELDKAAQAKKDAIDNNPELTDEEKAAAKAEVDKELEEGKKAIDNATDLSGVQSAESSTKTNIENIKPEHKGSFPWWILALIAGAIVLTILLIVFIVKRRNSEDDDGYDDYYDDEYDYDEEEEIEDDGDEAYGY